MKYKDLYLNYYLKSTKKDFKGAEADESYEAHIEKLRKFGQNYIENYQKNALNLIEFYKTCKKRKSRTSKQKENINDSSPLLIPSSNKKKLIYFENEDIYNKNILDENENLFLGTNMVSASTQTEKKFSDDESESDDF